MVNNDISGADAPAPVRMLYVTAEAWPTHRPDVAVLFNKYLPELGLQVDLLTEREKVELTADSIWRAGTALLFDTSASRSRHHIQKLWHSLRGMLRARRDDYAAIQVRDMPVIALLGLCIARVRGLQFFYWMSFPQSEGQIFRARDRGMRAGARYWFPLLQGLMGKWVLYKIVLRHSDHIFVQSDQMRCDVAMHNIDEAKMTPVVMGVDLEKIKAYKTEITYKKDSASPSPVVARPTLVYLGTLDRARKIDILFDVVKCLCEKYPDILLTIVGDTEDENYRNWLHSRADAMGLAEHIHWTGWLPVEQGWDYACEADIGLSPVPRGPLFDCASPTKAVEYMALGIPVVLNDNPDQLKVVSESGAGLCVALEASAFADAIDQILKDPLTRHEMAERGRDYVARHRSYDQISRQLMASYRRQFT